MPADARAATVARISAEEQDTKTRSAVAGFDLTFSVPKSVSALWALAPHEMQQRLYGAHRAAIASTLELIEREAVFTRVGARGVRRVRTGGVVAAGFDHWDSRKGDPQLHTHVTVANRVQGPDGQWRTLDSATLHKAVVAYSETYNQLLVDEVTRRAGLGWETRERRIGSNRRPARELAGGPDALIAVFSLRSADIQAAVDTAIHRYQQRTGRAPSTRAVNRIRQHLTLATRDRKQAPNLAAAVRTWQDTARHVLDRDPTEWASDLARRASERGLLRSAEVSELVVERVAARVVDAVAASRSTWTRWNLTAETMRHVAAQDWLFTSPADTVAVRDRVVAVAERVSIAITAPELAATPDAFRDFDGVSEFARPAVFTSKRVLDAEDTLLRLADDHTGPAVARERAERVAARPLPSRGHALAVEDQAPAAVAVVTSGRVVDVLVGPAGTGKTTSLAGVRAMWEAEHGPGSVVGLAPSAIAAQVLAADLGIVTDNTAQWLAQQHLQPAREERFEALTRLRERTSAAGRDTATIDAALTSASAEFDRWRLRTGQLLIVDEAGLAGTFPLTALAEQAKTAGAKLLLVGDPHQLSAVETGGAFGLLCASRPDPPTLTVVRRFTDPAGTRRRWEEHAAAAVRVGDPAAARQYLEHDRVHGGDTEQMTNAAYAAWRADTSGGLSSVLVAADSDTVRALNERARADLVAAGAVDDTHPVTLRDGLPVGRGDRIVTRQIDRHLPDGSTPTDSGRRPVGFVRNGQQWATAIATAWHRIRAAFP